METVNMQTLKLNPDGSLIIPKNVRNIFKPSDKIAWFLQNDTLILKKINTSKLSDIAERVKGKTLPLKEIVKEIHSYRKEKRK